MEAIEATDFFEETTNQKVMSNATHQDTMNLTEDGSSLESSNQAEEPNRCTDNNTVFPLHSNMSTHTQSSLEDTVCGDGTNKVAGWFMLYLSQGFPQDFLEILKQKILKCFHFLDVWICFVLIQSCALMF